MRSRGSLSTRRSCVRVCKLTLLGLPHPHNDGVEEDTNGDEYLEPTRSDDTVKEGTRWAARDLDFLQQLFAHHDVLNLNPAALLICDKDAAQLLCRLDLVKVVDHNTDKQVDDEHTPNDHKPDEEKHHVRVVVAVTSQRSCLTISAADQCPLHPHRCTSHLASLPSWSSRRALAQQPRCCRSSIARFPTCRPREGSPVVLDWGLTSLVKITSRLIVCPYSGSQRKNDPLKKLMPVIANIIMKSPQTRSTFPIAGIDENRAFTTSRKPSLRLIIRSGRKARKARKDFRDLKLTAEFPVKRVRKKSKSDAMTTEKSRKFHTLRI